MYILILRFGDNTFLRYCHFWYMISCASQGEFFSPETIGEAIFGVFLSIFGAALTATIFGKCIETMYLKKEVIHTGRNSQLNKY